MADFRLISAQIHLSYIDDEQTFALDPGCTGELALLGGGPNGQALAVRGEGSGIIQLINVAMTLLDAQVRQEVSLALRRFCLAKDCDNVQYQ